MFLGVLAWLVCSLFVLMAVMCLASLLRTGRPALDALALAYLPIFVITFFLLVMGLLGRLRPLDLTLVSVTAGAGLLAIPATRRVLLGWPADVRSACRQWGEWWAGLPRPLRVFTTFAFVLSLLRFAFLILALPPFVWDSLTYHLTNVAHWTQQGRIELFTTPVTRIYNPANFEVLASWFTVFLHHDVVIEAAGLPVYVLSLAAVYVLARRVGASTAGALIGALAYAATPALLLATTGTKNDPHVAAYYLSALAIVADLLWGQERVPHRVLRRLILLGLVLMLALGTKAYILHLTPGIVLLALLGGWWLRRQTAWLAWGRSLRTELRALGQGARLALVMLLAGGVFLAGFWNTRNLILTGNPFYPYGVAIGGGQAVGAGGRETELSLSRLSENLKDLAEKFGDTKGRIGPDLTNTTGWGWFVYGLGLPAWLWGLFRSRRLRGLSAAFVLSLLLLFLSDRPSPWSMRYAIWFPAIFAVAFAVLIDVLRQGPRMPLRLVGLLYIATLSLNFLITLNYGIIHPDRIAHMLSLPFGSRDSASLRVNMPVEYELSLSIVPRDAKLGYNVHSNGFIYPLFRSDYSQRLVYIPFTAEDTCQAVGERMQAAGTRYLFVAPEHTRDELITFLRNCAAGDTPIRERARGLYVYKPGE